ncbi:MAG: flavodoxin [Candidatus Delongbacteria bacterium]|nr:flavodoxin [Candidatus Delongbacteria bacterium]
MTTIVIYRSKSGFVKKYAEWISEELITDLKEYSQVSTNDLSKYRTIIYGGGIYISGINGVKFITNNLDEFEDKNIIVFASGASSGKPEDIDGLKRKNFTYEQLKIIKFFYLRGGFDFKKLKFPFTILMRFMKWKLTRQKLLTDDEKGMLEAFDDPTDFTNKENIQRLVEYVRIAERNEIIHEN